MTVGKLFELSSKPKQPRLSSSISLEVMIECFCKLIICGVFYHCLAYISHDCMTLIYLLYQNPIISLLRLGIDGVCFGIIYSVHLAIIGAIEETKKTLKQLGAFLCSSLHLSIRQQACFHHPTRNNFSIYRVYALYDMI